MHAHAEHDPPVLGHARVALDHGVLDLDRAAHRVDGAPKLDDRPVAGALDHAALVDGDGRVDEVAAQRPQAGQQPLLVRPGEAREADDVGDEDRGEFPGFGHRGSGSGSQEVNMTIWEKHGPPPDARTR